MATLRVRTSTLVTKSFGEKVGVDWVFVKNRAAKLHKQLRAEADASNVRVGKSSRNREIFLLINQPSQPS